MDKAVWRNKKKNYYSLKTERETIWYVPRKTGERVDRSVYMHMLTEDVGLGVIPYRRGKQTGLFDLSIDNEQVKEDLCLCLSSNDYHRRDFDTALCDFLRECVRSMMHYDEAIYEIVQYTPVFSDNKEQKENPEEQEEQDQQNQEEDLSFTQLMSVPPSNIRFFLRTPYQILPKVSEDMSYRYEDDPPPRFKKLSKNKILRFRIPKEYRGDYYSIRYQLEHIGKRELHNHYIEALDSSSKNTKKIAHNQIDMEAGSKNCELAVLSATNKIGWDAREKFTGSKHLQEHYIITRFLRFERFKIRLRQSIIDVLNENIDKLLPSLNYHGSIEIRGLPTETDVLEAEKQLMEGKKPFNEIIDPFLSNQEK